jgi:glycogen debranching enzyme
MIKYYRVLASFLLIMTVSVFSFAQKIHLGLLINGKTDAETIAAYKFLESSPQYIAKKVYLSEISSADSLAKFDVLWYHYSDTTEIREYPAATIELLNQYLTNGGKMLLTLEAFQMINTLGIEPNIPEIRYKKASDNGYGRLLGLHSFKSHPVFDGLNGGAYLMKLMSDTVVRQIGYFDDSPILNGAVVAVDWDYIFVRENSKLMLEYWTGKGRVLALGEYVNLTAGNLNRLHLEKFLNNSVSYLINTDEYNDLNYWHYYEQQILKQEFYNSQAFRRFPKPWHITPGNMVINQEKATNNFWDIAGERMLVMGKENGGIDEIWSHPFMALRDYEVWIKFESSDSIINLNTLTPKIEVRPESFTRNYHIDSSILKEIITASPTDAAVIIHYSFNGNEPISLFIKFRSNLRLMWPYSEYAVKIINCGFDINLNAIIIKNESEDYSCIIGSNMEPFYMDIGQYSDFNIIWQKGDQENRYFEFEPMSTNEFQAMGIFQFNLLPEEEFDIVITADNMSSENTINTYVDASTNAEQVYISSRNYYDSLLSQSLMIETPDSIFNEGYKWAIVATDKFFVNTPGLGKSLVAGYSTTNTGWDGGHKISGRPGYGWYFGRDGEWSGFALLDYGDYGKVKSMLEFYQKFQDLNGKIFHEVSTSGFVHYDASDATPLYIALAGRYLHYSGDIDFIKESWPYIKKAIDYCYSTDTDNDNLIENTNVGHGWVEGGGLFGSHTSLYLASCWAAALDEAAYIAEHISLNKEASKYKKDAEKVKNSINGKYWDSKSRYYYHGMLKDGSFIDEQTIMPAIPMLFGQADDKKAAEILPAFAGHNFSTDWGTRIIKENSKYFNPNGYHTGSVWPLFTGWTALAEYEYGNSVQGFSHIMNNLQAYKNWGLGFVEEVLNGEKYKPSGVCPHQCWSETMVLQPAIEGMLGFKPDAPAHTIKLSPHFPADWNSVNITNIKAGDHTINLKIERKNSIITYSFNHNGNSKLKIIFAPQLPNGTVINSIEISDESESKNLKPQEALQFHILKTTILKYKISGGIKVLPISHNPNPDDISTGMRIISDELKDNYYNIVVEGISGTVEELKIYYPGTKKMEVKNATVSAHNKDIYTLKVKFDSSTEQYKSKIIKIRY